MLGQEMGQSPKMAFALFILSLIAGLHRVLSSIFASVVSHPFQMLPHVVDRGFSVRVFPPSCCPSCLSPMEHLPQLVVIRYLHVALLFALHSSVQTRLLLSHCIPLAARACIK